MTPDDQHPEDDDLLRASGRVRIIGAEPAGRQTSEPVEAFTGAGEEDSSEAEDDPGASGETLATSAELPHWTEAPTGEVPAVLARDAEEGEEGNGDPWSAMPAPTWREERTDWTAEEGSFEPSMLAQDDARLGSLDDSGQSDRQPWSFELPGHPADDDTAVVPAVGRPLSPEEPGEVAFRFDEVEGETISPAAPSEVRGGTTAVPQVGRGPDDDEPAVDAAPVASAARPPVVAAPPVPPAGDLNESADNEEPASPGRRGRRPMHRRRPVSETEEDDAGRSVEGGRSEEAERPVPQAPEGISGGRRPVPPARRRSDPRSSSRPSRHLRPAAGATCRWPSPRASCSAWWR